MRLIVFGATLTEIARAASGELLAGGGAQAICGISTDSRSLKPGELFVALRGERFDGHDYLAAAAAGGAVAALVERLPRDAATRRPAGQILVADTLRALGDLAAWHRGRLAATVVAVTGSSGKTTTKALLAALLAPAGELVVTAGTENNLIGVPRTLLCAGPRTRLVVLELGTNHPGEIARLAEISRPQIGIVTNVGPAHLEGLGSPEGVAREKAALPAALPADGLAVLPAESPFLPVLRADCRAPVVTFGLAAPADLLAEAVEFRADDATGFRVAGVAFRLPGCGLHLVRNALAALAAARHLGVSLDEAAARLRQAVLPPGRVTLRRLKDRLLIDDTYNANPDSWAAALETAQRLVAGSAGGRLLVAAGEMCELGAASERLHVELGEALARAGAARVWAVGAPSATAAILRGARSGGLAPPSVAAFSAAAEAVTALRPEFRPGDVLLVKGSRAIGMERIVTALLKPVARS